MKGYSQLVKLGVFSLSDVAALTGNVNTARSMLARLMDKGVVKNIRKNMYTCVNLATGGVVASKYQIACASSSSAYLTHHTAFEFYGLANQVYHEVYVASQARFKDFSFGGITYRRIASKVDLGIVEPRNTQGIRVADLERTVIDSIKDFEKIGGFEELLNCLSAIHYLDESKLRTYLDAYNVQVLFQKTGYLLEHFMDKFQLSRGFIEYCRRQVGKSTRYMLREARDGGIYIREWGLVVPGRLFEMDGHERDPLVE